MPVSPCYDYHEDLSEPTTIYTNAPAFIAARESGCTSLEKRRAFTQKIVHTRCLMWLLYICVCVFELYNLRFSHRQNLKTNLDVEPSNKRGVLGITVHGYDRAVSLIDVSNGYLVVFFEVMRSIRSGPAPSLQWHPPGAC